MSDVIAKIYPMTDMGNARMFADMFGDKVRYDKTTGKWMAWDGRRWSREDGQTQAELYCRGVSMYWYKKLAGAPDKKTRREIFRYWQYSSSATGARNLLYFAKSEPGIAISAKELDQHPYLLNVLDGTVDLRTGEIREHQPGDLITQLAPVEYRRDLENPGKERWDLCLPQWHPDGKTDGTWNYLKLLAGYCLTGDTSSRCFHISWGGGKNGKNVFYDTLMLMMGDYASIAPRSLVEAGDRTEHPTELADLWGKRMVLVSEPKRGSKLKTALVKAMTGDSLIKARFMRQDFFEFKPTHKAIMLTQNLPVVDETTDAIWDRLHKLRWGVRFDGAMQDPHLTERLRTEWTGILRWAIEGCLEWQKAGILKPTEKIEAETQAYRNEQNPAKKFVDASFVVGSGMFVSSVNIRGMLDTWNRFSEEKMLGIDEVYRYLREHGCMNGPKRMNGELQRGWHGVGRRAE